MNIWDTKLLNNPLPSWTNPRNSLTPIWCRRATRSRLITQDNELPFLEGSGTASVAGYVIPLIEKLFANWFPFLLTVRYLPQLPLHNVFFAIPIHEMEWVLFRVHIQRKHLREIPPGWVIPLCVHDLIDLLQTCVRVWLTKIYQNIYDENIP